MQTLLGYALVFLVGFLAGYAWMAIDTIETFNRMSDD